MRFPAVLNGKGESYPMGRLAAPADGRAERARLRAVLYTLAERESAGLYSGTLPWRCWLDRAARLGRYGFTNTLLIAAQWRAAIEVRSYEEWRARGRQVRKGETGVRILSPRGELRTVFDLAQTDGIPPEPERPVAPSQARRLLHRLAIDLGLDPGVADDHRNDLDDFGDLEIGRAHV